jgi:hypothetical protein
MKKNLLIAFLFLLAIGDLTWAQTREQILKYLAEPVGNKTYRKRGILDGNLVRTLFFNDGQIGYWEDRPSMNWPKGTNHMYSDGCTPLVAASVKAPGNGQILHPAETSYREEVDVDPASGTLWVNEPVPGYAGAASESPAISDKPKSWPETWPRSLPNIDPSWDGHWFGYFGKGIMNAEQEAFFVMDDSQDREFARPPYSYHPIANNEERNGLGLRLEVRTFQWVNVLAEDIIFAHYDIVNLADAGYDTTYFGFYADTGVGGLNDNGDDNASYDTKLDLAFAFDSDGKANESATDIWETGYMGYAYLESPGNSFNGRDDDEDGMVDEKRDDGFDNDKDWEKFTDVNQNGVWDKGEPLNNDVGKDGVGPFDVNYVSADEGEGNGIPDDGEPNFDRTDKDESDQIGLTCLVIERLANKGSNSIWPKNDEALWRRMNYLTFDTSLTKSNIQILFSSGPFPLKINKRERFSMALVMGTDYADMVFNKETVQNIYNGNYNFFKPPLKPTLTAIPGNKRVFLYWNDISERSYDNFLRKYDFEGYLLYRSEEPEFNDIKTITNSKGEPKFWKPIAQFDLKDGIKGSDPVGVKMLEGASFWRGYDNGLQHSYIDTTVVNGKAYYYALVAYDQGDPNYGTNGLMPTETPKVITQNFSGQITFVDINCAVVTPNAPSAGYSSAQIIGDVSKVKSGIGSGKMNVLVLNPANVQEGATYKVKFASSGTVPTYKTTSYTLTRTMNSTEQTITANVDTSQFAKGQFSSPFDGLIFSVTVDTLGAIRSKGWVKGFSNIDMNMLQDKSSPARNVAWPSDYEFEWLPEGTFYTTPFTKFNSPVKVRNITTGKDAALEIFDNDKNGLFNLGDDAVIIEYVGTQFKLTWRLQMRIPSAPVYAAPKPGDIFRFTTSKPFLQDDYFEFSTKGATVDNDLAKNDLKKIAVVPNPYVSAASWEVRNNVANGRGTRRLDFIHLPSSCTVRIYTVTGALIKTLEKTTGATDGTLSWNLITEDGTDVAYGLYIYHVDAPGVGEYIGKFAIIK